MSFPPPAIAIGFQFSSYKFDEPDMLTPFSDMVFLVKQDDRQSEQTFSVLVIVDNPLSPVLPATLQNTDPSVEFDYTLGAPGQTASTYLFPPGFSNISFDFSLNGDDLTEGFEAFLASSESSPGFITSFQMPTRAFADTQINIMDNDGECTIM